jgi:outer membrane receptor protein involved in Fe transport
MRYYNTISIDATSALKATLLTGVEYSNILSTISNINRAAIGYSFTYDTTDYQKNTGVFAQLNPSYKNKIFLTLAGRYDFNKNFGSYFNPRIGITTNLLIRSVVFKTQSCMGPGITSLSWQTEMIGRYPRRKPRNQDSN